MNTKLEDPVSHLKKRDYVLANIIQKITLPNSQPETDIYGRLLRSVVSQQLSVKAASTIYNRFLLLFPEKYPEAGNLLELPEATYRGVGLSGQKIKYLKAIADYKIQGLLKPELLLHLPDEDLINHLTKIKGVGRWTAEMLLMFAMDRPDVFPVDDLGIKNAMVKLYGLTGEKKEIKKQLLEISEKWKPYRTMASKYLWKYLDNK